MSIVINGQIFQYASVVLSGNTIIATQSSDPAGDGLAILLPSSAPGAYAYVTLVIGGVFYSSTGLQPLIIELSADGAGFMSGNILPGAVLSAGFSTLIVEGGNFVAAIQ